MPRNNGQFLEVPLTEVISKMTSELRPPEYNGHFLWSQGRPLWTGLTVCHKNIQLFENFAKGDLFLAVCILYMDLTYSSFNF